MYVYRRKSVFRFCRYNIKHLNNIQIQTEYIANKKIKNYTEFCTNEIQMACNSY